MLIFTITSVLLTLTIGAAILYYFYIIKRNNYWKKRNVPFIKPNTLFGNMSDVLLLNKTNEAILQELYDKFPNERFVGFCSGLSPRLLIRDPDLIKNVLVKDFQSFHNRNHDVDYERVPGSQQIFTMTGQKWKLLRQKLTPTFSSGKIKNMLPLIIEKGECLQDYVSSLINNGAAVVEVRDLMARYTVEVICSCAFGLQINSIANDNDPMRKIGEKIFRPSKFTILKTLLQNSFTKFFGLKEISATFLFFQNIVSEILHQKSLSGESRRGDFIDLLMELRNKENKIEDHNQRIEFTESLMTAQVIVFFLAGFHSSSSLLAFTLYELALNQEIQNKLRSEISHVIKKHDGKLTYEGINEMNYLEMVISEGLRRYLPGATLTRICTQNYKIPHSDFVIEKGIEVNIPIQALHFDEKYYKDSKKFIPERFTPEENNKRHAFTYLPFGEGPRICIAQRFALVQVKVGLVSILQKFSFHRSERTEDEITYDPLARVKFSKNGIWLKIQPLHAHA